MQITLNQADIELAISDYVTAKVKFEEGFKPVIDLKATRGPEGFTAIIDLTDQPAAAKTLGITEKVQRAPKLAPPATDPPAETPQEAAGEPEAPPAADVPPAGDDAASEADAQQEEQTEGSAEGAEPTTDGEKPRSLFAGLTKPRNS